VGVEEGGWRREKEKEFLSEGEGSFDSWNNGRSWGGGGEGKVTLLLGMEEKPICWARGTVRKEGKKGEGGRGGGPPHYIYPGGNSPCPLGKGHEKRGLKGKKRGKKKFINLLLKGKCTPVNLGGNGLSRRGRGEESGNYSISWRERSLSQTVLKRVGGKLIFYPWGGGGRRS